MGTEKKETNHKTLQDNETLRLDRVLLYIYSSVFTSPLTIRVISGMPGIKANPGNY